mmetsp:Transcript_92488/g.250925  ORF Transcript_92488/g.250925 Transcript_92488/m.250925 type:complete len:213 (+) Transcript_92488:483-1121(+)
MALKYSLRAERRARCPGTRSPSTTKVMSAKAGSASIFRMSCAKEEGSCGSGARRCMPCSPADTLWTRWQSLSATMMLPSRATATPMVPPKLTVLPRPSSSVDQPSVVRVVTTPSGVTFLSLLVDEPSATPSATIALPSPSTATSCGKLKLAAMPGPSAKPAQPLPARVVTVPSEVALRTQWLSESTTMMLPSMPTATPIGLWKLQPRPLPSA